jgi:hypothetical protein
MNQFERSGATAVVAESGYSAPYLYLLDDDKQLSTNQAHATAYTTRKVSAVSRAIHAGYGQGRGDTFNPWLRIHRNFSSPTSYQIFDSVGIHTRNHHFLSALEFHTALLVSYLGAWELRECLALWPYDHPHPDSGLDDDVDDRLDPATGLLEIAKQAGIDHGCFVGTTVPYIASIDLMFRMRLGRMWRLVGISCKPKDIATQSARAQERIELDRLYCASVGAHHMHEDGAALDLELIRQVAWMRPLVSDLRTHRGTNRLADFCARFDEYAAEQCASDSAIAAGRRTGLNTRDAYMFFRLGVWLHLIDVDLSKRVQMRRQIKRGNAHVLQGLKARYLGAHHG